MQSDLSGMLLSLVTLLVLASFIVGIAIRFRFLSFTPLYSKKSVPPFFPKVRLAHVACGFFLYLGLGYALAFLMGLFAPDLLQSPMFVPIAFLLNVAATLGAFTLAFLLLPKVLTSGVFFGFEPMSRARAIKDLLSGALCWLVAFPATLVTSELTWMLILIFTGSMKPQDQIAISLLQSTSSSPLVYGLTFISFGVFVPIIEETLFRGLFLNWIKKVTSSRLWGIICSSILFGLFHYSKVQGLSNIELIVSLSLLGGFLGFIYEKQRSLIASISLHATFNLIALARLLFTS